MSPSSTFSQKDESFFERSDLDKLQAETQRILEDEDAVRVMAWRNGEGVGDVKISNDPHCDFTGIIPKWP
jgi:hypothetical protein